MKKLLLALVFVVFASSLCYAFSVAPPASIYTDEKTMTITGVVESTKNLKHVVRLVVIDDKNDKTTVDLQWGTTKDLPDVDVKNKRVGITYFVAKDGRNIALTIRVVGSTGQ